MTDRPGKDGSGDGPEFGWLYGRPDPGAEEPAPEATRRIPVQPRPAPAAGRASGAPASTGPRPPVPAPAPTPTPAPTPGPTPGPAPAPYQEPRRGGGGFWSRRVRRPGFWIRTVLVLLLLWLVFIVAVPFITWSDTNQVAFEPKDERPGEQDGTTYLIVGSDSRADLTAEQRKELTTGNPSSELTDTIMLLHTGDGPNVLLSIPRDTQVSDKYGAGNGMINGLYSKGGYPLLARYLEDTTGIRIDQFIEIGLGGVADVVDAVGGVEICPDKRMVDPQAGLKIKKGCQNVDGATALGYSRSRKVQANGDLDRVKHQREVVAAIGSKVLSPWTVVNPVRWWRINDAVPGIFRFGEGTSKIDAGKWAMAMSNAGKTCTMPVTDSSAHTWDEDRARPLLDAIIEDRTDDITAKQCTPTGLP